jgi:hypothetical protein
VLLTWTFHKTPEDTESTETIQVVAVVFRHGMNAAGHIGKHVFKAFVSFVVKYSG